MNSRLFLTLSFCLVTAPAFAEGQVSHAHIEMNAFRPEAVTTDFELKLMYAQSADAWSTVFEVKTAQGNLPALNEVLKRKYGVPEEALTNFAVSLAMPLERGTAGRLHFGVAAEGLGYGLIQNPVVPELHVNAEAVGIVTGGYSRGDFHWALLAGMGREKRIDATSTDLIESIPLRVGALALYGFDFDLGHRFEFDRDNALNLSAGVKETLVETTTPPASSALLEERSQSVLFHRWQAKAQLEHALTSGQTLGVFDSSSLALEGIAGPQPLPITVLPRIWDYAHNLYPTPELGAMFGVGLGFKGQLSRASGLEAHAGFYSGYVGANLALNFRSITIMAATFGIENSAAYRVLGERLWQASLGFTLGSARDGGVHH